MLLIRKEQVELLRTDMRGRFVQRMMILFTRIWPQQTARLGDTYQQFIESSVVRANTYGISTEAATARFINLCLVWGGDFELRPEHQGSLRILRDPDIRGAVKVNEIVVRTRLILEKLPANWRRLS